MSLTPDRMLADPQQIIANLRRELDECRAKRDKAQRNLNETTTERDAALEREAAIGEVLEVVKGSPGDLRCSTRSSKRRAPSATLHWVVW